MLSKKKVKVELVVTGMHLLKVYGFTINEIYKKLNNVKIIPLYNQDGNFNSRMELILSNTINQLSFILTKVSQIYLLFMEIGLKHWQDQ